MLLILSGIFHNLLVYRVLMKKAKESW